VSHATFAREWLAFVAALLAPAFASVAVDWAVRRRGSPPPRDERC
jgi:hypothetical protein